MDYISDGTEAYLREVQRQFACELANLAIQSPHARFPSTGEATLAMLRRVYLKGRDDALRPTTSHGFDEDLARVIDANAARRSSR
jgi:hypothetical protein